MPGMNMNKMYRPKRPAMNGVAQKIDSMEQAFKSRNNKVRRPMTPMVGPAKPKYRPNPGLQARKDWIKTRVEMLDKKKTGIKRQQAYLPVGGPGGKVMNRKRDAAMTKPQYAASKMNRRERDAAMTKPQYAASKMNRRERAAYRMTRRENIKGMMKLRKNQ
jgi:hypothetical protein